ncbi:MAG: hypothetical protein OXH75_05725 [Acidobacteria bacterium]|nr:hypothetical protein [Acidobacteriota bacterium]
MLLLVAWLGVDVGVFYGSTIIKRAGVLAETRMTLAKMVLALDLGPRVSLILMIPVGIGLAWASGLGLDELSTGAINALFWGVLLVAAVWIWALLRDYRLMGSGRQGTRFQVNYKRVDWTLRLAVLLFFLVTGVMSLVGDGIWEANHVAWKAVVFVIIIAIGQWIDYSFRDFAPAPRDIVERGETPARLARLNSATTAAYPPVLAIYGAVIVMAILGIARIG